MCAAFSISVLSVSFSLGRGRLCDRVPTHSIYQHRTFHCKYLTPGPMLDRNPS